MNRDTIHAFAGMVWLPELGRWVSASSFEYVRPGETAGAETAWCHVGHDRGCDTRVDASASEMLRVLGEAWKQRGGQP